MNIGSFSVEILSEGQFEVFSDGHINRSPKTLNVSSKENNPDHDYSVMVGINPVLIQSNAYNILLDTGLGWGLDAGSTFTDVSNINTNLRIFGIAPEEITHVILSHLHYDHAAGSTYTDANAHTRATFPNASYIIHQQEWNFALSQLEAPQAWFGSNYQLDDLYRLAADNYIRFVTAEETEIVKGITIIKTGGHTPGHQVVKIESGDETAFYLGDLLPNIFHLNQYAMERADVHKLEAKKQKVRLLKQACNEKALLFFYHSPKGEAGHVFRDRNKKYVLAKQFP